MQRGEKFERTGERIRTSVLELLLERDMSSIRVADVMERAGIARSTFYLHYDSVYDVIQEVEDALFADIKELQEINKKENFDDIHFSEPSKPVCRTIALVRRHQLALRALLGSHGDANFQYHFRNAAKSYLCDYAIETGYIKPQLGYRDLTFELILSANAATIKYLCYCDQAITDEELALYSYRSIFGIPRLMTLKQDGDETFELVSSLLLSIHEDEPSEQ